MRMIVPGVPMRPWPVDPFFEGDAEGLTDKPLRFVLEEGRFLPSVVDLDGADVLYRGWILTPANYEAVSNFIQEHNGVPVVSPAQYVDAQFTGSWLERLDGLTPATKRFSYGTDFDELRQAAAELVVGDDERLVVKGASKSVKDDWDNAMFVSGLDDLERVVTNFRAAVPSSQEGTLLLRRFEGWVPGELRCWFVDGECVSYAGHPQAPMDIAATEQAGVKNFIKLLEQRLDDFDNPLFTVDVARSVAGKWRVVEVGSGMVSSTVEPFVKVVEGSRLAVLFDRD